MLQSSPEILPSTPPKSLEQFQNSSLSLLRLRENGKLSRRELTICSNSSLLLLCGTTQILEPLFNPSKARADQEDLPNLSCNKDKEPTKRAFLDISIDAKPVGRVIIGLYGDEAPAGCARFSSLVSGTAGISYRRKEFVKIMPNYVQHGGIRSYGVDAEVAQRTGSNMATDNLVQEWERNNERCSGTKNLAGRVGIIVRDPTKPPPKLKLVARQGKLEIDQEEVRSDPNGTEFVITTKDSPELDTSALVVGRVVEGMEIVQRIGEVKTVQENSSSPYFRFVFCF